MQDLDVNCCARLYPASARHSARLLRSVPAGSECGTRPSTTPAGPSRARSTVHSSPPDGVPPKRVAADRARRLLMDRVRPPVHDLAAPLVDSPARLPVGMNGGDGPSHRGDRSGMVLRQGIVSRDENPVVTKLAVQLREQRRVEADLQPQRADRRSDATAIAELGGEALREILVDDERT